MIEVWFYHLTSRTLDEALPSLLVKTLERGWRAVVQAGSEERAAAIDTHLWTFRPDAFLPHGRAADGFAERQPVYVTALAERPNAADVLFLVDGAQPPAWSDAALLAYRRVALVFDGRAEDSLAEARAAWKDAKAAGHDVAYWQQDENGRWEKKA